MKVTCLPLRCPGCEGELAARAGDRLLWCDGCRRLLEATLRGLEDVPAIAARPGRADGGTGPLHPLPFWRFRVAARASGEDPARAHMAEQVLRRWPVVWVEGYQLRERPDRLRLDLDLTRDQHAPEEEGPLLAAPPPCPRSRAAAAAFPRAYLLSLVDPFVDVTDLELSVTIEESTLVTIPFRLVSGALTDTLTGRVLPRSLRTQPTAGP